MPRGLQHVIVSVILCMMLTAFSGCSRSKPPRPGPVLPALPPIQSVTLEPINGGAPTPALPAAYPELPTATATSVPPTIVSPTATLQGELTQTISPTATLEVTATLTISPTLEPTSTITMTATVTPTITATPTVTPTGEVSHIVGWGDTLYSLARRYSTTVNAIMLRNGMANANLIYIGQTLIIPWGTAPVMPPAPPVPQTVLHVVRYGDTLSSLSRLYRTSVSAILGQNPWITNPNILPIGSQVTITIGSAPLVLVHQVRYGESVSSIARRYGVSVQTLVMANGLFNPNLVYIGQLLVIPR